MTRLNELLGTEFPIVQGGMANIATAEFAAAVSNAGAFHRSPGAFAGVVGLHSRPLLRYGAGSR